MLASSRRWAIPSAERRVYCTPAAPPTGFSPVVQQNQTAPNLRTDSKFASQWPRAIGEDDGELVTTAM